ncbi:DNA-3-methyladenine glycosylase [Keratinibaculum paraultunense]|uniref:Putative 3-methyladenine DNA glycosylase n=1 Tax=Keratinibaculum paraultunense TaxID=1278232 RepID=A0A4R3KRI0_9FIRM|nr:DNA-3-methyladenine glycosylase [Keratinibaculum paraultunense]QQY79587.1 DNA-3-methyladenine glycosylase [Keratinibaculum paraultunense]TCS87610.1 DNA-3-methyladenine glycosylase [Keratinibaculum paraultunense]
MKLDKNFYMRDTLIVAKELLGKILVRNVDGKLLKGKIVETEAYLGLKDKAAHSYGGRRTKRVETMYGEPGRAYVYFIYGMYYCFNIVTKEKGIPEAVLIRAIEPLEGIDEMAKNRFGKPYGQLNKYQRENLTNGPGKLSMAFNIDKTLDKEKLWGNKLYLEEGICEDFNIIETTRIGIDYAEEAKYFPYRFYIEGNPHVSKL